MKLTLLGTGSFITDLNHFGPGYLLEIDDKKILIDAGQGTVIHLLQLGIKVQDLDYIFITHFHADHTADIASILLNYYITCRNHNFSKKIKILGPVGTKDFLTALVLLTKHKGVANLEDFEVEDILGEKSFENFQVEAFKVEHLDLDARAFKFTANGKSIVLSGDVRICEGIKEAAKEVDLFVVDSSMPKGQGNEYHLATDQIADICRENGVKKVILSHVTQSSEGHDSVAEVREGFDGEVILGEDLKSFEV